MIVAHAAAENPLRGEFDRIEKGKSRIVQSSVSFRAPVGGGEGIGIEWRRAVQIPQGPEHDEDQLRDDEVHGTDEPSDLVRGSVDR